MTDTIQSLRDEIARLTAESDRLKEALLRARDFIVGPGDRSGPVLRHIEAALKENADE